MEYLLAYLSSVGVFVGFCVFAWKKPGWGLALMPIAVGAIVITAAILEQIGLVMIGVFLFPVTIGLVRWAPTASPLETPWYKGFAIVVMAIFQYLIILALMIFVFQFLGPILFLLFVVTVVRFKQTRKYSLALEILSAIGMSMRQSLPLPMALMTAANGRKRKESLIFKAIADHLSQGRTLAESIRLGYRKCPPELLATIEAAEKMDQLPEAIATLEQDIVEKVNDYRRVRPVHPWYPIIVACVAFTMVLALAYFIVPTFAEVLSDMSDGQASLPWMTQQVLNGSSWIKGNKGLNLLWLGLILTIPIIVIFQPRYKRQRRKGQPLLSRFSDWIKWHLPVVRQFERSYAQLQLIETLKIGLRAGFPVNITVRNALGLDMNRAYRLRVGRWLERIEQGQNISQSAMQCGIGRMLAWALDESVNKGNTPILLESMEEVHRSHYNYRLNLANSILCPILVVCLGAGVGFVVTAMFLPMVKMIQIMI